MTSWIIIISAVLWSVSAHFEFKGLTVFCEALFFVWLAESIKERE